MQISRISAESGKALEIRQDDTTAHNSQQSHFSMIIYRFLAPSMKNGESPEEFPPATGGLMGLPIFDKLRRVEALHEVDNG